MLTRYDPYREALSLRRAMDQLFEQSFVNPSMMQGSASMMTPMDVCETNNGYEVDVALPGVRPEDIELTVDQNTLAIRGHFSHQNEHANPPQQQQSQTQAAQKDGGQQGQQGQQSSTGGHRQGHNWLSKEIVSGSFERMVTFPRPIDTNNIQTKFENGILTIQLPINEASRPKRISVTGDQTQQTQQTQQAQSQQIPVGTGSGQQR